MCRKEECIDKINTVAPFLQKEFGVKSMCLFGSLARGDNNEISDVDLFVEMPPKAFKLVALKNYLQTLLGTAVDLVRRHPNTDTFLLQEIQRDGITII